MRELFLTSFGGRQYGIWKDAILSVRDIRALHRIPLSPPGISGIMIEDGRTVILADLQACIGYGSIQAVETGCILLNDAGGKVTGFVVSDALRTQSISPQQVFQLPAYVKTPVFDSCAVHDGIAFPIINITVLYSRILESDQTSESLPGVAAAHPRDISAAERIRLFSAAGELYAVSADGMEDKAVKPGPVTPLPAMPQFVKGVTFRDGHLLTVIDLTQRIKGQSAAPGSRMLIAKVADAAFGFLVDSDAGMSPASKVSIKPAPLIARSSWLDSVVLRAGELIPLVDLAMVLSPGAGASGDKPVWQRYTPDSGFPDIFFKRDVEVVEFALLGVRHALPKMEVEDVIPIKPCRALPDVPPIVIGVAEHNGEILPVVDLAMMFGRRSLTTPAWRMMLVKNGDFRALAITEAVFGERRLVLDIHRVMPVHLPHNLMYGCYPDDQAVRIILNVEAISVHFEKSLISKFMPALSHEMMMSPTGVVYTFPDEKDGPEGEVEPMEQAESVAKAEQEKAEREQAEREAITGEISQPEEALVIAQAAAPAHAGAMPVPGTATEPGPMDVIPAATSSENKPESPATADVVNSSSATFGHDYARRAPDKRIEAKNAIEPETSAMDESVPDEIPEPAVSHRPPDPTASGETGKAREPEVTNRQSALEALRTSAKKRHAGHAPGAVNTESWSEEPSSPGASVRSEAPPRSNRNEDRPAISSGHEVRAASTVRQRRVVSGAIVAALIAAFYFSVTSEKPPVEKAVQGTETEKVGQPLAQSGPPGQSVAQTVPDNAKADPAKATVEQAKLEADQAAAKATAGHERAQARAKTRVKPRLVLTPLIDEQSKAPRSAEKSTAPLELDIPASMPVDIEVYVVKDGDTLWSISGQFTGNPYNYPRIAGENRIANPDLIFPGQRIRLIK